MSNLRAIVDITTPTAVPIIALAGLLRSSDHCAGYGAYSATDEGSFNVPADGTTDRGTGYTADGSTPFGGGAGTERKQ